jgi:fluoroacetyl-CoA thioesterase
MTLEPGLRAAFRYTVTGADTAVAVGSGRVPVLATPRVLALAERATVAAVEGALEAGRPRSGSGSSWRSRRRWSGSRAGASSSPSACATAVGRWPVV